MFLKILECLQGLLKKKKDCTSSQPWQLSRNLNLRCAHHDKGKKNKTIMKCTLQTIPNSSQIIKFIILPQLATT